MDKSSDIGIPGMRIVLSGFGTTGAKITWVCEAAKPPRTPISLSPCGPEPDETCASHGQLP